MENRIRRVMKSSEVTLGTMVQMPSEPVVEILGYAGFDWVAFDMEHSSVDLARLETLVLAARSVDIGVLVRLGGADRSLVERLLDLGVDGLLFPRVSSAEDAAAIVRMTRLAPRGTRGAAPEMRAGDYNLAPDGEFSRRASEIVVGVMIETREGVTNVESILEVEGVDLAMLGAVDLAFDLDVPMTDPSIADAGARLAAAADRHGTKLVQIVFSPESVQTRLVANPSQKMFWHTCDTVILSQHFKALATSCKAAGEQ